METNKPFKILEVDFKKGIFRMTRPPETMEEHLEMEMAVKDAIARNVIANDLCTIQFEEDAQSTPS